VAPELVEWRDFFVATTTVAGTLVGLLFVAVSVHLRLLSDEHHADLHLDARSNLTGYVVAMILAVLPLIPQSLFALGAEVLMVFVFLAGTTVRTLPQLFKSRRAVYGRRIIWLRAVLLIAGDVASLSGGVALLSGQTWPLQMLAVSVIALIVISVLRTWDIVFRAAAVRR